MKKFFIRLVFRPVVHPPGVDPGIPGYKPGAKNRLTSGAFNGLPYHLGSFAEPPKLRLVLV